MTSEASMLIGVRVRVGARFRFEACSVSRFEGFGGFVGDMVGGFMFVLLKQLLCVSDIPDPTPIPKSRSMSPPWFNVSSFVTLTLTLSLTLTLTLKLYNHPTLTLRAETDEREKVPIKKKGQKSSFNLNS